MRQGQQSKRMRGRSRKGPNPMARTYESNGPDVKIRGTALHIAEKYLQLARDAQSSGDRVAAESYLQHAEHYFRIVAAAQAQMPQTQPQMRSDVDEGGEDDDRSAADSDQSTAPQPVVRQPGMEPQPRVNGNGQAHADGEESGGNGSGEPPEGRDQPSGYRGRRRRPYRERASAEQAEASAAEAPSPSSPEPVAEASADD